MGGQGRGEVSGGGKLKPLLIDVLRRQEHFVASLGGLVAELRKSSKLPRPQQVHFQNMYLIHVCTCIFEVLYIYNTNIVRIYYLYTYMYM